MDGGKKVWAPDPVEGYQLGVIVDVDTDTLTVQPLNAPQKVHRLCLSFVNCPPTFKSKLGVLDAARYTKCRGVNVKY